MGDDLSDRLVEALLEAKGSKTKAAQLLGVSRSTVYRWMKKYGATVKVTFYLDGALLQKKIFQTKLRQLRDNKAVNVTVQVPVRIKDAE